MKGGAGVCEAEGDAESWGRGGWIHPWRVLPHSSGEAKWGQGPPLFQGKLTVAGCWFRSEWRWRRGFCNESGFPGEGRGSSGSEALELSGLEPGGEGWLIPVRARFRICRQALTWRRRGEWSEWLRENGFQGRESCG